MNIKILVLLFGCFLLFSCSLKKSNNNSNTEEISSKEQPGITQVLLNEIDSIKMKSGIEKEPIFFVLDFDKRNDSTFLTITYDLQPPYFFSTQHVIGYTKYGYNFIIFISSIQQDVFNYFVDDFEITTNLNNLVGISDEMAIDSKVYLYYINDSNELIFLKESNA